MSFILLCLFAGAFFVGLIQKYILRIKEPDIKELWFELDKQSWYEELSKNVKIRNFLDYEKENGLLNDPYYVRKIIDKEGHRQGFINYVNEKTK